jgi:translation initiation factor 3 subunit I
LNKTVIVALDDFRVVIFDLEQRDFVDEIIDARGAIMSMSMSHDFTHFIVPSKDSHARVYDSRTFELLREVSAEVPLNAAALNPVIDQLVVAGGQEARDVTTTASTDDQFVVRVYDKIQQEKLGELKGHIGPVHTMAYSANGQRLLSGSEDGMVMLWVFDPSLMKWKSL